ncbi:MAG: hypothetical protein IJ164_06805 [Duodenibacillus sp.]|nr:hypothetical protein [Duodenibacillus sp.]
MTTRSRYLISLAAAAALALSSVAYAGPHGGPHGGPRHSIHHGGPHPVHHGGPRHHHHGGWIWGPLAAGAVIYGLAELSRPQTVIVQQPAPATLYQSYQGNVIRYVYWCEAEQGYYPQVRACPTGWRQMPAP